MSKNYSSDQVIYKLSSDKRNLKIFSKRKLIIVCMYTTVRGYNNKISL